MPEEQYWGDNETTLTEFTYRSSDDWPLFATISLEEKPPANGEHSVLIQLHGGGPDHHSMVPLAWMLTNGKTVVLPDIRGYGRSVCTDPARHTWAQYADDVIALLDHLGVRRAVVGGAGLGEPSPCASRSPAPTGSEPRSSSASKILRTTKRRKPRSSSSTPSQSVSAPMASKRPGSRY